MATKRTTKKVASLSKSTKSKKKATTKKATAKKTVSSDVDTKKPVVASATTQKKSSKFRWNIVVAIILVIIAAGIFFVKDQIIVVMVNGKPLMRWELVNALEKQWGKETLDALVMQKLIEQEAQKKGIVATKEEIDGKISEIEEQVKAQGQELDNLLDLQGMSRDQLRDQLRTQVLIENLVGDEISVTDEEVDKFISDKKDLITKDSDPATIREDARSLLKDQKINKAATELTKRLRDEASLNYFREY